MELLGIDFGTTNTVAALALGAIPVRSEQGSTILPSVVAYTPTGTTLVGTAARRRRAIDSKNTIFSAKRLIGRGWRSAEAAEFRNRYPFDLVETTDGMPAFRTRAGDVTPVDVASTVIAKLLADAPIDVASARAAIAVPSAYRSEHREATLAAARAAGLRDVVVVDEPIATAAAYLAPGEEIVRHVAVYDLGGGTFDFALIDCSRAPYRVIAHGGDLYLGGDDIDHALAGWAAEEVARTLRWDLRADPVVFDRLVVECERAKIRLCYAQETRIELAYVDPAAPAADRSISVDRELLTRLSLDLVRRTFVICDAVLSEAGLRASRLDGVFLAGGATLLPMVRKAVSQYFSRTPRAALDPMEVVGLGTCLAHTVMG